MLITWKVVSFGRPSNQGRLNNYRSSGKSVPWNRLHELKCKHIFILLVLATKSVFKH
jgi:hypothetical protein